MRLFIQIGAVHRRGERHVPSSDLLIVLRGGGRGASDHQAKPSLPRMRFSQNATRFKISISKLIKHTPHKYVCTRT